MSSKAFYQMGGIALILSGVLTISTFFTLMPNGDLTPLGFILDLLSLILLVPGFLALSVLYRHTARGSSLAAVVLAIAGILIYGLVGPLVPAWENIAGLIGVLGLAMPIMLFGIASYRHPQPGPSRINAMIGISTGVIGIVNVISVLAGGGDWKNTDSLPLQTLIFISYAVLLLVSTLWCLWTGWLLFSQKSA